MAPCCWLTSRPSFYDVRTYDVDSLTVIRRAAEELKPIVSVTERTSVGWEWGPDKEAIPNVCAENSAGITHILASLAIPLRLLLPNDCEKRN